MVRYIPRWLTCSQTVTHPSSNRAGRRATSFIETSTSTTSPCRHLITPIMRLFLYRTTARSTIYDGYKIRRGTAKLTLSIITQFCSLSSILKANIQSVRLKAVPWAPTYWTTIRQTYGRRSERRQVQVTIDSPRRQIAFSPARSLISTTTLLVLEFAVSAFPFLHSQLYKTIA